MGVKLGYLTKSNLFAENFVLRQQAAGTYNEFDEFVPGATTDYSLKGNIEPAGQNDRSNTVAGARSHDAIKVSVNATHLISAMSQGNMPKNGDIILYSAQTYLVQYTHYWVNHDMIDIEAIRPSGESDA